MVDSFIRLFAMRTETMHNHPHWFISLLLLVARVFPTSIFISRCTFYFSLPFEFLKCSNENGTHLNIFLCRYSRKNVNLLVMYMHFGTKISLLMEFIHVVNRIEYFCHFFLYYFTDNIMVCSCCIMISYLKINFYYFETKKKTLIFLRWLAF